MLMDALRERGGDRSSKEVWLARLFLASGPLATALACWEVSMVSEAMPQLAQHAQNWLIVMVAFGGTVLNIVAFLGRRPVDGQRLAPAPQNDAVVRSPRGKELQFNGIIESIDEVLWTFSYPGWHIEYVSPAVERVYGRSAESFYADPNLWLRSVHPADRQRVMALSRSIVETGRKVFQYRVIRPDGEVRRIRYEAHFVAGALTGTGRVDSVGTDITIQYRLEESLRRSTRALHAIRECEQVIAAAADEAALLQHICDMIAAAGYRMAWAGLLDKDGNGSIVPVAITGEHQGYLECVMPSLHAGATGNATVGEALRTGQPVVVNDFRSDLRLTPWREDAIRRGINAKIALPLIDKADAIGILNVYAVEQDAFDTEEVNLLDGLARRVTASIQAHRHRQAREAAEAALRLRERAIEASANSIMIVSAEAPSFPVQYVNPAFEKINGYVSGEVVGKDCCQFLGDHANRHGSDMLRAALRDKRAGNLVQRNARKDGTSFWNEIYLAPVSDEDGEVRNFVVTQYDITAMKQSEAKLQHQAHHDALTGLPNRFLLYDRLGQAIASSSRQARPIWLLFVDLDRFKFVNDSLGHKAGDALLQTISGRLQSAVRQSDTVARLGGDEFVLILPERTDGTATLSTDVVQRILDTVAQPLMIEGHEFFPTCSIGVAAYPDDGADADTLMMHADIAMYRAKETGRNNFQFFASSMNEKTLERLRIEGELRRALEREEFVLHYQPQVDLHTGHIVGMEALIRWHHPELGMVMPQRFIGLAEETGLIVPIGAWVLRAACMQNRAWQLAGFPHLRVSVNLSARQFAQHDLAQSIIETLAETGLPASSLEIELTETLVMADVERTIETLRALKAIGVQLSIDDFGTGYSSLSYLRRFPIDVLKIDRSFVRDMTTNPDDAAIVASIISLSHSLKLHVIAEGVETQEQLSYLRSLGCDEMQGYFFSRPVSADIFEQLLHQEQRLALALESVAA
jgi:diguanylate cyclase (GGDEF)-like protein/PAS domain S-box-containing protein